MVYTFLYFMKMPDEIFYILINFMKISDLNFFIYYENK